MEEEAPRRPSVSELAGRFKSPAAANEADKPVRRRPPRSLQLPKAQGDHQESAGATSPLPSNVKRNSALIEKLQANLALSPSAPPKSPGFRLLPPSFGPPSPSAPAPTPTLSATPTSPTAASPVTEEGPASFEAPPTAAEGGLLLSVNKGRARHSIRRRPPSRRHRKSSCGDEVNDTNDATDTQPSSTREGGGEEEEEQRQSDALTSLHRNKSIKEDETKNSDGRTDRERQEGGASSEPEEKEKEEKEEESSEQIQKHEEDGIDGTEKENNEEALHSTR